MARFDKQWKRDRDRQIAREAEREIREALLEKAEEVALRNCRSKAA